VKKKKTVFLISFIVFVLLFAVLAIFVVPRKKYTFPLYENKLNIAIVGDSLFCNKNGERNLAEILESKLDCEMLNCSIGGTCASKLNDGLLFRQALFLQYFKHYLHRQQSFGIG
jgi:hypothetical protein